jgi:hypothetical protein
MSYVLIAFIAGVASSGGGPVSLGEFTKVGACKDAGRRLEATMNRGIAATRLTFWTCLPVERN